MDDYHAHIPMRIRKWKKKTTKKKKEKMYCIRIIIDCNGKPESGIIFTDRPTETLGIIIIFSTFRLLVFYLFFQFFSRFSFSHSRLLSVYNVYLNFFWIYGDKDNFERSCSIIIIFFGMKFQKRKKEKLLTKQNYFTKTTKKKHCKQILYIEYTHNDNW